MGKENLKRSFDLGIASTAILVAFGIQLVFQIIVLLFGWSKGVETWTIVVGNQVILFAVSLFFCSYAKVDPFEITGIKRPPKWYFFPLFFLIAVCCIVAFAPLAGLFSRVLAKLGYEHTPNYHIPKDPGLFTLAFFGLTLLPVIGEEMAVRGVLLSGAKSKSPIFAILFTALIFALMHGNLRQVTHQFLLGLVMGYLAYLTGGIYASATVHIANNGLALLLEYGMKHGRIDPRAYYYICGEMEAKPTIVGIVVGLFALSMLLVLVTCLMHFERSKEKEYLPVDGSLSARVAAYLRFLSDDRGKDGKRIEGYSLIMPIFLTLLLALVVLLTLIPGGKG